MKKQLPVLKTGTGEGEENVVGRRCVLAALGALGLAGPACFTGDGTPVDDGGGDASAEGGDETATCDPSLGKLVGDETTFPVGTWSMIGYLIIAQDTLGFFAFSAICTHQGCPVDPPDNTGTTFCPCHGSMFDGNGNVIQGPAFAPLPHYLVNVCAGSVYVDTSTKVASSSRTPPA